MQAPQSYPRHLQVVPTPTSPQPAPGLRSTPMTRRRSTTRRRQQTEALIELSLKLGVNILIMAIAGLAFGKLWRYHTVQQVRLGEAQQELAQAEQRLAGVQKDFSHYFDPQKASTIMQEQTHRLSPEQRQIVWINPYSLDTAP